jgi:hypothetical protein
MSKKLFHYTPVFRAVMILRDGVIRRSSGKVVPPYVWLSSNPTNEPTANRIYDARTTRQACGQARFVFHGCVATPWADLRLSDAARSNLEQLAEPKGGLPEEWFVLPDDVPCRDLPLEIETLEGPWQEIEQDDLQAPIRGLESDARRQREGPPASDARAPLSPTGISRTAWLHVAGVEGAR